LGHPRIGFLSLTSQPFLGRYNEGEKRKNAFIRSFGKPDE